MTTTTTCCIAQAAWWICLTCMLYICRVLGVDRWTAYEMLHMHLYRAFIYSLRIQPRAMCCVNACSKPVDGGDICIYIVVDDDDFRILHGADWMVGFVRCAINVRHRGPSTFAIYPRILSTGRCVYVYYMDLWSARSLCTICPAAAATSAA